MRELTFEELELVAGGDNTGTVDGVTVTPPSGGGGSDGVGGGTDGMGGGGDGGSPSNGVSTGSTLSDPNHGQTPCIHLTPTNADLQTINGEAKYIADEIGALDPSQEWGSIIYEHGGVTYFAPLQAGTATDISFAVQQMVPDNSVIVGWEHSHVAGMVDGADQRTMSPADVTTAHALANINTSNNITGDPNLVSYVHNDEDGQTYAYDMNSMNHTTPDCTV